MSIEIVRSVLLWCTVINLGLLLLWALLFLFARDGLQRLTRHWFPLSSEQFTSINFAGILFFKMGVILFNLVPYIALRIVG
jgi:hypothetical protein